MLQLRTNQCFCGHVYIYSATMSGGWTLYTCNHVSACNEKWGCQRKHLVYSVQTTVDVLWFCCCLCFLISFWIRDRAALQFKSPIYVCSTEVFVGWKAKKRWSICSWNEMSFEGTHRTKERRVPDQSPEEPHSDVYWRVPTKTRGASGWQDVMEKFACSLCAYVGFLPQSEHSLKIACRCECLSLDVGPAIGCRPVFGVPRLLSNVSCDCLPFWPLKGISSIANGTGRKNRGWQTVLSSWKIGISTHGSDRLRVLNF